MIYIDRHDDVAPAAAGTAPTVSRRDTSPRPETVGAVTAELLPEPRPTGTIDGPIHVTVYLEIRRGADDTVTYGPAASAAIPSGAPVTWPTVPDGVPLADTLYSYRAWATDTHGTTSPSTEPCYFLIDDVDPGDAGTPVADLWVYAVGNRPSHIVGPILLAAETTP